MTYQKVGEIITRIREAHEKLRNALQEAEVGSTEGVRQDFLTALAAEESNLESELARHQDATAGSNILETWLQYVPDEEMQAVLKHSKFKPDMSVEETVAQKTLFDQALFELYASLARQSSNRVQELFESLRDQTESQIVANNWNIRD